MRDYKFNHSGLDFDKPKRPIGRWLLRLTIFGLVAFGAYAAYQSVDWDDTGTTLRTSEDPNVIPLKIPPNSSPDALPNEGKVGTARQNAPALLKEPETLAHASIQSRAARPSVEFQDRGWRDTAS